MINVITRSSDETKRLAMQIGQVLRGGEVFDMSSDVGGGKTTFAKGLAKGLGIDEVVQSPTFTISRLYKAHKGLELHHFDFYRLSEAGIMAAELAESLVQSNAVVVVEWGDIVYDVLPQKRVRLRIRAIDEEVRSFDFGALGDFDYIRKAIADFDQQRGLA